LKDRPEPSLEKERAAGAPEAVAAAAATAIAATDEDKVEDDDVKVNEREGTVDDSGALLVESVGEWFLEAWWW
jgi:hypothetical protein